jgi:hypothetical protein
MNIGINYSFKRKMSKRIGLGVPCLPKYSFIYFKVTHTPGDIFVYTVIGYTMSGLPQRFPLLIPENYLYVPYVVKGTL